MYFIYYSWDSYFWLRFEGVVEVVIFTIDNNCDKVLRKINNKNRRELLQGLSQFFQENEVQHVVSPHMTVPLYLRDQHGVKLRFFLWGGGYFSRMAFSKYTTLSPSFSTPQIQNSRFFLVLNLLWGFVTLQSMGKFEICAAISSSVLVCMACKLSSYVGIETYEKIMFEWSKQIFKYFLRLLIIGIQIIIMSKLI